MVKLSDALRGAADKAPLDGLSLDGAHVARRASRSRMLHTGANGLLGAGAVALVAIAVIGPGTALTSGLDDAARGSTESGASADMGAVAPGEAGTAGAADGSSLAWGLCGSTLPAMPEIAGPLTLSATAPSDAVSGDSFDATVDSVASVDGTFETFGVDGVVLWDGIVVGTVNATTVAAAALPLTTVELVAGEQTTTTIGVPLVNCWDGGSLPAGSYELVLTQELWAVDVAPVEEPPVEEPSAEPGTVEPGDGTVEPDAVEPSIAGGPDDAVSSDNAASSDSMSSVAAGASTRVIAAPVGFTVAGDPVEDPFAEYLGGGPAPEPIPGTPVEPDPLSDSALDAATARELYLAGLTGAWDMAPGTQRWLATADGMGAVEPTWWGCGYEGDARFPARSAQLDLLAVDASTPASIDVSYGWIVDGNPEVSMTVTNTSTWDLTQFWGLQSVSLALVKDGRVVAEAYPVDPHQNQVAYAMDLAAESEAAARDGAGGLSDGDAAMTIAPDVWGGFLAAGDTAGGTYLWRDVNTCWTEAGQLPLEPGTYTLLAMHQVSVPGASTGVERSMSGGAVDDAFGDTSDGIVVSEPDAGWGQSGEDVAIAPAPGDFDWFELQVWTSLGSVSVR